jgi:hypothetical protein
MASYSQRKTQMPSPLEGAASLETGSERVSDCDAYVQGVVELHQAARGGEFQLEDFGIY